MKRKIAWILMVCLAMVMLLSFTACSAKHENEQKNSSDIAYSYSAGTLSIKNCGLGDDPSDWHTYYKVYKGNDGYWHGKDVTYYAGDSSDGSSVVAIIVIVAIVIAIAGSASKKK